MAFNIVRSGYHKIFKDSIGQDNTSLRLICPFIKTKVIRTIIKYKPQKIQVITRYDNIMDFYNRVSDIPALKELLINDTEIRGIEDLHSKVYIFGETTSMITSANLTETAFSSDIRECGAFVFDADKTKELINYFGELWDDRRTKIISQDTLKFWEVKLKEYRAKYPPNKKDTKLPCNKGEGKIDFIPPYFIKFAATSHDRVNENDSIKDWIEEGFSHRICAFSKTPRQMKDNDIIFLSYLCAGENGTDTKIIGRAIASRHTPSKDIATERNKIDRPWMRNWPYFIRIRDAEILKGSFKNAVSLRYLENTLGRDSYFCSQVNGTNPRNVYKQQPSVRLSAYSYKWLNDELNKAFQKQGKWKDSDFKNINPV
jgi:hypothetical protein